MIKYDIEAFFADLLSTMQAKLNTKLLEIDSDKNDGITLPQIASTAYFFQNLDSEIANFNPFIYYGLANFIDGNSFAGAVDVAFTAQVVLVLSDDGNDPYIIQKLFRYQRALMEIFQTYFANISQIGTIKITGLEPLPYQFNKLNPSRIIGVAIEVHLP